MSKLSQIIRLNCENTCLIATGIPEIISLSKKFYDFTIVERVLGVQPVDVVSHTERFGAY
jgi:hypothetical protein